MRTRWRYDADLDCLVRIGGNYFEEEKPKGPTLISDTMPGGVNGTRGLFSGKQYDSKSAYYGDIKRRGLAVNEPGMVGEKAKQPERDYQQATRDADAQISGNWNGTRDWLRHRERGE